MKNNFGFLSRYLSWLIILSYFGAHPINLHAGCSDTVLLEYRKATASKAKFGYGEFVPSTPPKYYLKSEIVDAFTGSHEFVSERHGNQYLEGSRTEKYKGDYDAALGGPESSFSGSSTYKRTNGGITEECTATLSAAGWDREDCFYPMSVHDLIDKPPTSTVFRKEYHSEETVTDSYGTAHDKEDHVNTRTLSEEFTDQILHDVIKAALEYPETRESASAVSAESWLDAATGAEPLLA